MTTTIEDIIYLRRYAEKLAGRKDLDADVQTFILKTETALREAFPAALEIALKRARVVTDVFWNEEFGRHGNSGLAALKTKLGHKIESELQKEHEAIVKAVNP